MAIRRSVVVTGLVIFMVNLILFIYIPLLHRVAQLHSQHLASSPQQKQQQEATPAPLINLVHPAEIHQPKHKDDDVKEEEFDLKKFTSYSNLSEKVYAGPLTRANDSSQLNRTKIVGFITANYAKIAMRWYDRLEALGYNNHYIICTDPKTYDTFLANFTHYRVEGSFIPPLPKGYASLRYGKKMRHLVKMLFAHRWVYLMEQLQKGYHVLITDVDNIFSSYHDMAQLELSEIDVFHALETKHPTDVYNAQGFVFCGGMGWFRSSPPTITFIQEMLLRCRIECDDQVLLNRIIAYILKVQWNRTEEHLNVTQHDQDTSETVLHFGQHFQRIVGLVQKGFTGYSKSTGLKIKVWDRDFAYRGKNDPSECPQNNWVSMPFVVFVSRWQAPSSKMDSYDLWDQHCPNDYTKLMEGREKKNYKQIQGI